MTFNDFALSVLSSITATGIVGGFVFSFFKGSLYSRIQKYTNALPAGESIHSRLGGAKSVLIDFRERARARLIANGQDPSLATWFDKEMTAVLEHMDGAIGEAQNLNSAMKTLRRIGDELK